MSIYFIGDIHGCFDQLQLLLKKVQFNKQNDQLWSTGDLVSRGPKSFEVVKYLFSLGDSLKLVLGNHDLHLITSYLNQQNIKNMNSDMISFFQEKESHDLIMWMRQQPLLRIDYRHKFILSHAGVYPNWSLKIAQEYAYEATKIINSDQYINYFNSIANIKNNYWNSDANNIQKFYFTINSLTRMRYCELNGSLNMKEKLPPNKLFKNNNIKLIPWFEMHHAIPKEYSFIFGHWSALNGKGTPKRFFPLDTGCCWGKNLTLLRWEDKKIFSQPFYY
ncbi:Bis(5'-nucleosyl)-tetraphosphatase [symmetrical] [Buchnera aphidicola (Thelaxes suberi)]|uniref:symmetrical bis(5'-nucleosyl)-tetraphosphatase n=1 Tax=Buchnera aphidicola TaxID=9 RepID=UPI003464345A